MRRVLVAALFAAVATMHGAPPANACHVEDPLNPWCWTCHPLCWIEVVDPAVCPLLAALAPGVPGVVDIGSDGDVFVFGEPFWDCPPYGL